MEKENDLQIANGMPSPIVYSEYQPDWSHKHIRLLIQNIPNIEFCLLIQIGNPKNLGYSM